MKKKSVRIDTVPLPEKPFSFDIPVDLVKEFKGEMRVVLRHPWVVGIPAPELLMKKALFDKIKKNFDVMLVPKQFRR